MATLSLIITLASTVIAIGACEYARRSANAAARSANADEDSALEAARSSDVAEISTVHAARNKILQDAPDVYMLIHKRPPIPTLITPATYFELDDNKAISKLASAGTLLSIDEYGDHRISFTISGIIVNDGSKPVAIKKYVDVGFIDDESEFHSGPIAIPPMDAEYRYILPPGQVVHFKWPVNQSVEMWRDVASQVAKDWGPID